MTKEYRFGDRFGKVAVIRGGDNSYSLTVYGHGLFTTSFNRFGDALIAMCNYGDFRQIQSEFGRVYVLEDGMDVIRIWDGVYA